MRYIYFLLLCTLAHAGDLGAIPYGAPWRYTPSTSAPTVSGTNGVLNANPSQVEFIFHMREAATITGLGINYVSRTGTPPTYKISLQGVTTSTGRADGTIKLNEGNEVSATFTPPATTAWNGSFRWFDLAAGHEYSASRGELLALVVAYSSGTVNASNCSSLNIATDVSGRYSTPYVVDTTGTKVTTLPVFAVRSSTATYGNPMVSVYLTSISSGTEHAMAFSLPASACSTYKVIGVEAFTAAMPTGKSVIAQLYTGTTADQQVTLYSDTMYALSANYVTVRAWFTTDPVVRTCGTTYYAGFAPQEAGANFRLVGMVAGAAADLSAYPGGTNWYLATRSGGAWTAVTTTRPLMHLILSDITPPAGEAGTKAFVF
jgi:hypothetical protein